MPRAPLLRWLVLTIFLAALAVSTWRRRRARRAGGTIPRRVESEPREPPWIAKHLGTGVDLRDKDALWEVLDREEDDSR